MRELTPTRNATASTSQVAERRPIRISVIIPALNEAGQIGATLRHVPPTGDVEVIVVDGGSGDRTAEVAAACGARVFRAVGCRANQMNLGAAVAHGEILLFLHADTRLPADFGRLVRETLSRPGIVAGAFRLRIDSPQLGLRLVEALANFRSIWLKMPYGDQALFLRARYFRTAVGFSKLPIMEDFEFIRRLGRWGRIALAPAAVLTSARRWERLGVLRTTLINQAMILGFLLGVSPARLARWYSHGKLAFTSGSREADTPETAVGLESALPPAHGRQSSKPLASGKHRISLPLNRAAATLAVILALVAVGYLRRPEPRPVRFPVVSASADSATFSFADYGVALARHVDQRGLVDYRGLKADSGNLDAFATSLSRVRPEEFKSWSERRKIAFWINSYNALTLEVIIRNYPIQSSLVRSVLYPRNSIRQIPGAWDKLHFVVLGREMTLNDIEHGTLRANFNEPRIHVALVCAAMSCPPLRNEPYFPEKLDQQLDDQSHVFLRSQRGLRIEPSEGRVYLSSIFKWFGDDFIKTYGTSDRFAGKSDAERAVLNFVSRYVDESGREFLLRGAYKIDYLDYDWSLNEDQVVDEFHRHAR